MWRHGVVLALGLSLVSGLRAQEPNKLTGIWEITVSPKNKSSSLPVQQRRFVIDQKGDKLSLLDFQDVEKLLEGSKSGENVEVAVQLQPGPGDSKVRVTLKGSHKDHQLLGSAMVGGQEVEWKATRLVSVWMCSNHTNPVHTAKSEEEIRRLTDQHGCKGWRRLKPDSAEALMKELMSRGGQKENKP